MLGFGGVVEGDYGLPTAVVWILELGGIVVEFGIHRPRFKISVIALVRAWWHDCRSSCFFYQLPQLCSVLLLCKCNRFCV